MPCDHLDVEPIQERGPHEYLFILNSRDDETVWNCLRFGSAVLERGHEVTLFLLGPGVEIESIQTTRSRFRISSRNLSGSAGKP